MLSCVIKHRNNASNTLIDPPKVLVRSCEWNILGGPSQAQLEAVDVDADAMDAVLGGTVTISSGTSGAIWWGFVYSVEFPYGNATISLSLEKLVNRASVLYTSNGSGGRSQSQTNWNEAYDSINRYGVKELIYTMSDADQIMATLQRDMIIASSMKPKPVIRFSPTPPSSPVKLTCYGEWKTLEWQYYGDSDTGTQDSVQQIIDMLNYSQRAVHVINDGVVGVDVSRFKKSTSTILSHIKDLVGIGDVNGQRIVLKYLKDRSVVIKSMPSDGYSIDSTGVVSSASSVSIDGDMPIYGVMANLVGFPNGVRNNSVAVVGAKLMDGRMSPIIENSSTPFDMNTIGVG